MSHPAVGAMHPSRGATVLLTVAALCAFAANSLLCRLALRGDAIDPRSFTLVRLASGAIVLALLIRRRAGSPVADAGGARQWWLAPAALAGYAIPFALAYVVLPSGTGALLLFGAVQVTLLGIAAVEGTRLEARQLVGAVLAFGGLVVLVRPGTDAPPIAAAIAMLLAGVAWGIYTRLGRGVADPTRATARNFAWAVVPAAIVGLLGGVPHATGWGSALAVASGAIASGLGYALWYRVVGRLAPVTVAVAQLAVPVITAVAGVLLLGEPVTARLLGAAPVVLGGIALAVVAPRRE